MNRPQQESHEQAVKIKWSPRLPKHWREVPVRWYFHNLDGKRVPLNSSQRAEIPGEVPYWGSGGIVGHIDRHLFEDSVLLVGEDGAPFFEPTRPVSFVVKGRSWINNHIHVMQGGRGLPLEWYCYAFNCVDYSHYIDGTTRDKLTQEGLKSIFLPAPPPTEAAEIVGGLDRETARIDALIEKKTRFIELLKEKRQALITQAVTKGLDPTVPMKDSGVEWIGEVPAHWVVARTKNVCTGISTGPFGTALGNNDYVTDGIPVINPSHIIDDRCVPSPDITVTEATARRLKFWRMQSGDLVAARRGEVGRCAAITEDEDGWICGTGSLRVRPDLHRIQTAYLKCVMDSSYAREWLILSAVGSTMANLNEDILGRLPLAFPPSIQEQSEVLGALSTQLTRLDKLAHSEKKHRASDRTPLRPCHRSRHWPDRPAGRGMKPRCKLGWATQPTIKATQPTIKKPHAPVESFFCRLGRGTRPSRTGKNLNSNVGSVEERTHDASWV